MGGEKVDPTGNDWYTQGSPPRRRGKDLGCKVGSRQPGITPAQAGKRNILFSMMRTSTDHPRVGGEK